MTDIVNRHAESAAAAIHDVLAVMKDHVFSDLPRRELIEKAAENRDAIVAACGALATWSPEP